MQNSKYDIVLFYSHYDGESQRTRFTIHEFIHNNSRFHKMRLKEVNYNTEKKLCARYGVGGTPTVLIYKNNRALGRYFGVINYEEFKALMENVSECKNVNIKASDKEEVK